MFWNAKTGSSGYNFFILWNIHFKALCFRMQKKKYTFHIPSVRECKKVVKLPFISLVSENAKTIVKLTFHLPRCIPQDE